MTNIPLVKERALLPCPFCGGEADQIEGSAVACFNPGCFGPQTTACGEDAIEQWNMRAAWRPIKTAPRKPLDKAGYGPEILLFVADQTSEGRLGVGYWDRDFNKFYVEHPESGSQPTHWMPMPEPPK